ncbi:helix-turn-helix domain-containing protein [Streptomyces cyaneochromogenes]|uniref:Helix-turn-helix domain-containing protein n=1 Tax=Streptomyces cyaneochromogenes TaxID=2496836 RepID=A0A3S9M4Q9_9ACTN|nr:helix-turn-helix domain-containing protein [Streptomyces cyaneochromogenes]AZQ34070.1 helix-turn-helix domain-containing protein [Streptomyces cyaneochromogenes]
MNFHGTEVRQRALTLLRNGARNADVARQLNVPAGTIGKWLHLDRSKRGECPGRKPPKCPRCDGRPLDQGAYSYLLGLYLGDGYIVQWSGSRTPSLIITCDNAWPGLMDECEQAMHSVFPNNAVCRSPKEGCHDVKLSSNHLRCMFPQHGPGKKHERPIALEPWQQEIVDTYPWEFIRGLIHSDGCRITNWATRLVAGERKRYEYPRYFFTNLSGDIMRLFTETLDYVGVDWRHANPRNISIARKASVALMDTHVGPKH